MKTNEIWQARAARHKGRLVRIVDDRVDPLHLMVEAVSDDGRPSNDPPRRWRMMAMNLHKRYVKVRDA